MSFLHKIRAGAGAGAGAHLYSFACSMKSSMLANISGLNNLMGTTFISRWEVRARVSMSGGGAGVTGQHTGRESLL